MRLQCRSDLPQIVWQPLAEHDPVLFITDDHHRIVRVQVYATIFHVGLRRVKAQLRKLTLTPPLQRGEEAGYMIIIQAFGPNAKGTRLKLPALTIPLDETRRRKVATCCG